MFFYQTIHRSRVLSSIKIEDSPQQAAGNALAIAVQSATIQSAWTKNSPQGF